MKIVFTPDWFLGKDVLIDVFSFLILLTFFILSTRSYQLNKKKSSFYLGLGFLLIAVGQLASVLTKVVLYSDTSLIQQVGQAVVESQIVQSVDIFYYLGFFFYKLFTLAGLFLIYRLSTGRRMLVDVLLIAYFVLISVIAGTGVEYVFYLTALILLMLITKGYYKVYKKSRNPNTLLLIVGFTTLAISQIVSASFARVSNWFVVADLIELASYFIFLTLIIKILASKDRKEIQRGLHGKKKK